MKKKIWKSRLMTLLYVAPILIALGACGISGTGSGAQGGGGCVGGNSGNTQATNCSGNTHPCASNPSSCCTIGTAG